VAAAEKTAAEKMAQRLVYAEVEPGTWCLVYSAEYSMTLALAYPETDPLRERRIAAVKAGHRMRPPKVAATAPPPTEVLATTVTGAMAGPGT
jgi:hypothetical protein